MTATRSRKPVLLAPGHPDTFQTPASALDPLLPFLKRSWSIWEPSCGKGNLVKGLRRAGHSVIGTDPLGGRDALTWCPPHFDAVVGNPPFSLKDEFLARCYQLARPFALLMPVTVFDSGERRELMNRHGVQLLLPNGRIHFETPNHAERLARGQKSSSWFYCCWVTWRLRLPGDITFSST